MGVARSTLLSVVASLSLATFATSARAAPSARECIAANESSIQLRKAKHLREAREQLLICAEPSCPADIRTECARDVSEVTAAIPSLVISAQDAAGNDLVAVKVSMDGKPLAQRLDGSAIPLDPGPHDLELEAAGQPRVIKKTIVLREGEKDRRELFRFEPEHVATPEKVRDPGRRTLGLVTGVVGALGLGVGVASGIVAAVLWSNSKSECSTSTCSTTAYERALADHNSAEDWANVSTASFIAGGVVLAVGGVLFFTAPWVVPGKSTSAGLAFGFRL